MTQEPSRKQRYYLGFALFRLKRWNGALEEFLTSNEREPAPSALFYVAQCYRELHQDSLRLSASALPATGAAAG
jgi:hypothetical protein